MIRILQAAAIAFILSSCDIGQRELVLANPDGAVDREIATNLVGLLDDDVSIGVVLTEDTMTGGQALDAIEDGRVDIALISNDQPFHEDIATVMPLYATVLHVVHPADRPAADVVQLLQNADVYAGQEGSASRRVLDRVAANIDLGDAGYRFVTDRSVDVDLVVIFAPIAPDRLAEYSDIRLWTMGTPGEIGAGRSVDAAILLNPHFRPFIIPAGTYGDAATEPVVTIAVDKLLVTRKDLDASIVYDLINEVSRLRPALAAQHPGVFQHRTSDFDASRSRFILHAGAQDYLQRSEPTFIERYSGVAEVFVTLMVAAFSATLAGVQIYNRRRKNRVDRFYSKVIEIRNSISPSMNKTEKDNATGRLREIQDEAFGLLVDEKLAADESFRIFMALCNDVHHQLGEKQRNRDAH